MADCPMGETDNSKSLMDEVSCLGSCLVVFFNLSLSCLDDEVPFNFGV